MSKTLDLAARVTLDAQRWVQGLSRAQGGLRGFTAGVRAETAKIRQAFSSVEGRMASLGVGFSAVAVAVKSAKVDQELTRIKQTAGLTVEQTAQLRHELHAMAIASGQSRDSLQEGFSHLVAGGLAYDKALPTIRAVNESMAVTGSEARTLTGALLAAQEHFKFDLSRPGQALELLDKMTVAGRAGVIEIEDLSGAFASAASSATRAGLDFDQTLALFEGLGTATTKDRLGTLVDSTLRLFSNDAYRKQAQKATGVSFYGSDGSKRDPLVVLADIAKKYKSLTTDKARDAFLSKAFGKTDIDTQKGLQSALSDGKLEQILQIANDVRRASGATSRDFSEAIDNAVAQSARLKASLGEAGDRFAQPINEALANAVQFALKDTKDGGLQLSGNDMLKIGGGLTLASLAAYAFGPKMLQAISGKFLGGAAGVAEGKVLEAAAGVTPVFVTNYAQIGSGLGTAIAAQSGASTNAIAGKVAGATVAAVAGWWIGEKISDNVLTDQGPVGSKGGRAIGEAIGIYTARQLAPWSEDARRTLAEQNATQSRIRALIGQIMPYVGMADAVFSRLTRKDGEVGGEIHVRIDSDSPSRVTRLVSSNPRVPLTVGTGRVTAGGSVPLSGGPR